MPKETENQESSTTNVEEEIQALIECVYSDGYHCGITDDKWFSAYAKAVMKIIDEKVEFSDNLVSSEYSKL